MDHAREARIRAGISRKHRWSKRILKGVLSIVIVALVLKYQFNRPKVPLVYQTSNPDDTFRGNVHYTCGCSLPATMQARNQLQVPETPTNATFKKSENNTNVCLEGSSTVDVNVLMYPNAIQRGDPNFTQVGILDDTLQDAYGPDFSTGRGRRNVTGYLGVKRAHDISWHNSTFLKNLSNIYLTRDAQLMQRKVSVDYLMNNLTESKDGSSDGSQSMTVSPFLDFPASYVNLALAYNCTDCSRCPLEKVNQIFRTISGDFNSTWGSCDYWWHENQCGKQNWYTAKCVLYPTEALPLNLAIDSFLQELTNLTGPEHIFTPESFADKNGNEALIPEKSMTSFSANVLYMDFSKVVDGSIQLNFFELEKYSAAWLTILDSYPSLDSECSKLNPVDVAKIGTAICNVFTNAKDKSVDVQCIEMSNKTVCEDDYIYKNDATVNVTVDAVDTTLWSEYNVTPKDWADLMCMKYKNVTVPPYRVLWKTHPAMQNSSLNRFLESKHWSTDWDRSSGVCINSYNNVSPQNFEDSEGNKNMTVYMETKCHGAEYCWLTGRYHRLTDMPDQEWHNLSSLDNPPHLFVCYTLESQNVWIWMFFICAILFGWLGTADLICEWIIFPISKLIWLYINKLLHRSDAKVDSAIVPTVSVELQRVVVLPVVLSPPVMRHIIFHDQKSRSDTWVVENQL